jgi:hypothetical protein
MFAQDLRHYCRNPRCRSKLPSPTDNHHRAFCCKGCHSSFYLKRCIVCENDKPSDWRPCSPSVLVADDLSIPDFLKRELAAVSESPDGILEAAE